MNALVSSRLATCLLGFTVCATGSAWAVSIPVTNPGFEDPFKVEGAPITYNDIVGWPPNPATSLNISGTFNPTTAYYDGEAPEGQMIAFVNGTGQFIYQTINQEITPGLTYTLQVDVGRSKFATAGWDYQVELRGYRSSDNSYIQLLASDTSLAPELGQFLTSTVTWTAPDSLGGLAYDRLGIGLVNLGSVQVNFDDVRLEAVPIPAAAWLFGSGLLGMVGIARKKKAA